MSHLGEPETPSNASPSVDQLIQWLAENRDDTSIEIAETLWLSMVMEPAATIEPESEQPLRPDPIASLNQEDIEDDIGDSGSAVTVSPAVPAPRANLATPTVQAGVLPPKALPVWLADPALLTDSLAIIRALKPLLKRVDAGLSRRLDEAATVEKIARTRLCWPITQPEQEPWFDIVLLVDRGSSMHIWDRLVKDIVRILRRYGAFRNVQPYDLMVDAAVQPQPEAVRLISNPRRPGHRPTEIIDQRGRRIVMVLSDCAAGYWWDGTLLPMLKDFGQVMPTVVWQMLPPWMWRRTAMGRGLAIALRNDRPGAANQQLAVQRQERRELDNHHPQISIPVITSEVIDLERWSLMVAGDRRAITPGFLLPVKTGTIPRSQDIQDVARDRISSDPERSDEEWQAAMQQALQQIAEERVQRFLELSSPSAQRLLMLLAAAPVITLPVVRLIRDAMMSQEPSPLPIAEVFLGGLLKRLPGQDAASLQPDLESPEEAQVEGAVEAEDSAPDRESDEEPAGYDVVQYDFLPHVRDILLKKLPVVDTVEVVNRVSAAVERRWNHFSDETFRTFLLNPQIQEPEELQGMRSFASVTADILKPLGGQYAEFAEALRRGMMPPDDPLPPNDPPTDWLPPLTEIEYDVAEYLDFPPLESITVTAPTIIAIQDRFEFTTATLERNPDPEAEDQWLIQQEAGVAWGYREPLSANEAEPATEPPTLSMIAIDGGSFTMGADDAELDSSDSERPTHEVTLQPFHISQTPITQTQWRIVAGYDRINRDLDPDPSSFKGDNRPVEKVSWEDAQEFCQRLTAVTGKPYRLPTEAEWEYACRAGSTTPFSFGETITTDLANYRGTDWPEVNASGSYGDGPKGRYREETTKVGIFPANAWGLHDTHGNVLEWCEDDWHLNYEGVPIDGSARLDLDENRDKDKLLRGGSWDLVPVACRSAYRTSYPRELRFSYLGFRVCCAHMSA
jgi:formylglycine-generating enzyme required for sulfatase activity